VDETPGISNSPSGARVDDPPRMMPGKPVRVFAWSVYLLAFSAPLSIAAAQFFAAISLLLGHYLLVTDIRKEGPHPAQSVSILAFMTVLIISSMASGHFEAAIPQLKKSWVLFCFFPITVLGWSISDKRTWQFLVLGTTIASLIGIARCLLSGLDRASAFSGGYTTLALFEATVMPYAVSRSFLKENRRWLYWIIIPILGVGLLLTETRAGWLAAIVGTLIVGFHISRKITLAVLAGAIILIFLIPSSRGIFFKRFETEKVGGITSGRAALWSYARAPISELPVFGYGPGSFERLAPDSLYERVGDWSVRSWHSTPLDILIELGPLGLISMMGAVAIPLMLVRRRFVDRSRSTDSLVLIAALISLYIAGLTTNLFRDFMIMCLILILWSTAFKNRETDETMVFSKNGFSG
jgi:O-antigen ligase